MSQPRQRIFNIEENLIESDDMFFNPGWFDATNAQIFSFQESPLREQAAVDDADFFAGGLVMSLSLD